MIPSSPAFSHASRSGLDPESIFVHTYNGQKKEQGGPRVKPGATAVFEVMDITLDTPS